MNKIKKAAKKIKEGFLREAWNELNWIFKTVSVYRIQIAGYACLNLAVVLIGLFFSMKSKDLVDSLVEKKWNEVIYLAVIYMLVGTVNIVLAVGRQRMSAKVSTKVKREVTDCTYKNVMMAKWEKIVEFHSGDIITRMNDDITAISDCVVGWIPELLVQSIQIVIALICIIYYDASMLVLLFVVAPVIIIGPRIFLGKIFSQNKAQKKVASEVTTYEKESFQNIHTIKAFGLEQQFCSRMEELQVKRQTVDLDSNKYSVASWAVMYISGQLAALICLVWAVYHVYTGKITLGTMTLMVIMASLVSTSFKSLITIIPNAMSTIASAARVRGLLELEHEVDNEEQNCKRLYGAASKNGVDVRVNKIDFAYDNGKKVFDQCSFDALKGEMVALVGPSGEGKTTMLRVLLGIVLPQDGDATVFIHGQNEKIHIGNSIRKMIAYVPQGNTMMSGTIADNMKIVKPDATDEEIVRALRSACAYEFVEKLPQNINFEIGESGVGFSEGQNQRLAIARALLCDAPILLLDEATSALDVATERKVLQNLMQAGKKRTCILTTHRPSVLSMCDKVYRIADKKIHMIGEDEIQLLINEF